MIHDLQPKITPKSVFFGKFACVQFVQKGRNYEILENICRKLKIVVVNLTVLL